MHRNKRRGAADCPLFSFTVGARWWLSLQNGLHWLCGKAFIFASTHITSGGTDINFSSRSRELECLGPFKTRCSEALVNPRQLCVGGVSRDNTEGGREIDVRDFTAQL